MKKKPSGIFVKLLSIGAVIVILLIALTCVSEQLSDRENSFFDAESNIVNSAGGYFSFAGPFIAIPVTHVWYEEKITDDKTEKIKKTETSEIIVNASKMDIKSDIKTEERKVGIYSTPVFTGSLSIEANYNMNYINTNEYYYQVDKAKVYFICNAESLTKRPTLTLSGKKTQEKTILVDNVNINGKQYLGSSVKLEKENINISATFYLRGAELFTIKPSGEETSLTVESNWPSPGFTGFTYLPDTRELTENGFSATWNIPFAKNFNESNASTLGFRIIQPVNLYQKLYRATNYGILFILIPFVIFFLFEIFAKVNLHPIQYLFCGLACVLFFLLLISISEQIDFGLAYGIASCVTSILVSWYIGFITKRTALGFSMIALFLILYGYLYISLMSEDYAFLIGSFFIFAILVTVMFVTRKVNWSELGSHKKNNEEVTMEEVSIEEK